MKKPVVAAIAIASILSIGLAAYYATPKEKRMAIEKQERVEKVCDEMMADAAPGDEKRLVRQMCESLKSKAEMAVFNPPRAPDQTAGDTKSDKLLLPIDPFTVNLEKLDTSAEEFLILKMNLKLADEASRENAVKIMPQIRSRMLLLLTSQNAKSLKADSDHSVIKIKIMDDLTRLPLPENRKVDIKGVEIVSFQIQSF